MKTPKPFAVAIAAALTLGSGTAFAQGAGSAVLVGSSNAEAPDLRGPDDTERNINNARDEATRRAADSRRQPRGNRAVPATPEDFTVGAEVRDSAGTAIGTIAEVGMGAVVVQAPGGKVSVPFESFGKNRNGLLVPITKAEFDALVADANRPSGG